MTRDTVMGLTIAVVAGALTWLCYDVLAIEIERRRERREGERYWAEQRARRYWAEQRARRAAWRASHG